MATWFNRGKPKGKVSSGLSAPDTKEHVCDDIIPIGEPYQEGTTWYQDFGCSKCGQKRSRSDVTPSE